MAEELKLVSKDRLENFEKAFRLNSHGCWETCKCGKIYFDTFNSWDWEEGELERLSENPDAIGTGHAIERLYFQGDFYVTDCTCWHKVASQGVRFLHAHRDSIKAFFKLEKERLKAESDSYDDEND